MVCASARGLVGYDVGKELQKVGAAVDGGLDEGFGGHGRDGGDGAAKYGCMGLQIAEPALAGLGVGPEEE